MLPMRVEPLVERAAAQVGPRGRALDCGCGRGQHAVVLAAAGLAVDAFDRDEAELERLRRFISETGVSIDCFAADLASYAPAASTYAVVVATKVLHLFAPAVSDRILAGLRAAVIPGGVAVVTAFAPSAELVATFPSELAAGTFYDAAALRDRFAGWDIVDEDAEDLELDQRRPDGGPVIIHKVGLLARRPG